MCPYRALGLRQQLRSSRSRTASPRVRQLAAFYRACGLGSLPGRAGRDSPPGQARKDASCRSRGHCRASFGAYAEVVQSPAYRDDKRGTTLQMLPDLLKGHHGAHLSAHAGHTKIDGPQALLVSNDPYGMGDVAGLGRRARLDAGTLGVVAIRVQSARQAAGLIRRGHGTGLTALTAGQVTVDADAPEIPVGIDGETVLLPTPVRCTIQPRALRVVVPRDRPGVPAPKPTLEWPRLRQLASFRHQPDGRPSPPSQAGSQARNHGRSVAGGLSPRPGGRLHWRWPAAQFDQAQHDQQHRAGTGPGGAPAGAVMVGLVAAIARRRRRRPARSRRQRPRSPGPAGSCRLPRPPALCPAPGQPRS
jgi:hypothetical protein